MPKNKFQFNIPITKMDQENRLIYGVAASSDIDSSGEYMDWKGGKQAFIDWNNAFSERSNGLAYGNIREMHIDPKTGVKTAAGVLSEPVTFDDENEKVLFVGKIVDDQAWAKCEAGLYNSVSVGGGYKSRVFDPTKSAYKYVPVLKELTLCDLPMNLDCTFELIKCDGTTEVRKFNIKDEKMTDQKDLLKAAIAGELQKAMSDDDLRNKLDGALGESIKVPYGSDPDRTWFYVDEVYQSEGYCIIRGNLDGDGDRDNYKFNFTVDGDVVKITSDGQQVKRGDWIPTIDESGDPADSIITVENPPVETVDLGKASGVNVEDDTQVTTKTFTPEEIEAQAETIEKADSNKDAVEKSDEQDELQKAGAKHSKETVETLQKMHHEIAAIGGACKCGKCQKAYVEGDLNKSNTIGELM